jgi:hypothetical protein
MHPPKLILVQLQASFVREDDDGDLQPITFTRELSSKDWQSFDLQAACEAELAKHDAQ